MRGHYETPDSNTTTYSTTGNGKQIESLRDQVRSLEDRIDEIEDRIDELEDQFDDGQG